MMIMLLITVKAILEPNQAGGWRYVLVRAAVPLYAAVFPYFEMVV
jgi:hypothetical protein